MDKILPTIKQRILKYIDSQSIKKEDFYRKTAISASNFKGNGLYSEIGGENIVKILSIYKDLSPAWLLLGTGSMILDESANSLNKPSFYNGNDTQIIAAKDETILALTKTIEILQREIAYLQENQLFLKSIIEKNNNIQNKK